MRKRFDIDLHKENDKLAKRSVKALFQDGMKRFTVEEGKRTEVDLIVSKNGEHLFNIETEIKRVWKGKEFPYENVQFPERKEKFAKLDKPTLFVMWNADQSAYLVVRDEDLINSPRKEVPNKYVYKGELFFQVPKEKAIMNNLKSIVKTMEE